MSSASFHRFWTAAARWTRLGRSAADGNYALTSNTANSAKIDMTNLPGAAQQGMSGRVTAIQPQR